MNPDKSSDPNNRISTGFIFILGINYFLNIRLNSQNGPTNRYTGFLKKAGWFPSNAWPINWKIHPAINRITAHFTLQIRSGSEIKIIGIPIEWVNLFMGCWCSALYRSLKVILVSFPDTCFLSNGLTSLTPFRKALSFMFAYFLDIVNK